MASADPKDGEKNKEVFNARDRFSGALSSAVDKVESCKADGDVGQAYFLGSPVKRHLTLDSPWSSPTKSPRSTRRRRKKEIPMDSAFHHTFVMKLFDRSLDLAQFPEKTSLYPVCRAWMKNQPHNTNMAPRIRSPTPEPPPEDDADEADDVSTEEGGMNGIEGPEKKKPKIYHLPPCTPLNVDENGVEKRTRIPDQPPPQISEDLDLSQASTDPPAPGFLLEDHMRRWSQVRKRWRESYAANEKRYSDSFAVMKSMFES